MASLTFITAETAGGRIARDDQMAVRYHSDAVFAQDSGAAAFRT